MMPSDTLTLTSPGQRVRWLRELRGLELSELARRMKIDRESLYQLEVGITKRPSAPNLLRLAALLEASPYWIIDGSGDPFAWPEIATDAAGALVSMFNALPEEKQKIALAIMRDLSVT